MLGTALAASRQLRNIAQPCLKQRFPAIKTILRHRNTAPGFVGVWTHSLLAGVSR